MMTATAATRSRLEQIPHHPMTSFLGHDGTSLPHQITAVYEAMRPRQPLTSASTAHGAPDDDPTSVEPISAV
jgi:hypothetical protein